MKLNDNNISTGNIAKKHVWTLRKCIAIFCLHILHWKRSYSMASVVFLFCFFSDTFCQSKIQLLLMKIYSLLMRICLLLVHNYYQLILVLAKSIDNIAVFPWVFSLPENSLFGKQIVIFKFYSTLFSFFMGTVCSKFAIECHLYASFFSIVFFCRNLRLLFTEIEEELSFLRV